MSGILIYKNNHIYTQHILKTECYAYKRTCQLTGTTLHDGSRVEIHYTNGARYVLEFDTMALGNAFLDSIDINHMDGLKNTFDPSLILTKRSKDDQQ